MSSKNKEIKKLLHLSKMQKSAGLFGGIGRFGDEILQAVRAVGKSGFADDAVRDVGAIAGVTDEVKSGINLVHKLEESDIQTLLKKISDASEFDDSKQALVAFAKSNGYSGISDADDFIREFGDDFKKLGDEITSIGTRPDSAKLKTLYDNNKKVIDILRKIKDEGGLESAFSKTPGAAGRALKYSTELIDSGGKITSALVPAAALWLMYKGGSAIWNTEIAQQIWAALQGYSSKEFQNVGDAAECIKRIKVKPGSVGSKKLESVSNNLKLFSNFNDLNFRDKDIPDPQAIKSIFLAGATLVADNKTEGSILDLVSYLCENPEDFSGYDESILKIRPDVFGSSQTKINTIVKSSGAAKLIGGALAIYGTYLGYKWLTSWYKDELECLESSAQSIKKINDDLAALFQNEEKRRGLSGQSPAPAPTTQPSAVTSPSISSGTSDLFSNLSSSLKAEISSDVHNLVGKTIFAMQTIKVPTPGLDLVNERGIAKELISKFNGNQALAADLVLKLNDKISLLARQILSIGYSNVIDKEFLRNNKEFATSIVLTIPNAIKSFDRYISYIKKQSSQKRENIMNKVSKSINNEELLRKAAKEKISYFDDASLGLKDQLTKSYYAGLTGMYNEDPPKRSSDYKELYDVHEETGSDLVLQSHPKSVTLADSMGKGGLVENGLEQKEKTTQVALTTPTGNFQSKYAQTITYLEKLSKAADKQGKKEVSSLINQTIKNLK